ncbi:MAG: glycoside hydrolase, partial [Glycomyces artemisiae]|nr:glycoside hydrolase [Glycomyces artemisiae]
MPNSRTTAHAGQNRRHPSATRSDPNPRHVRDAEVRIDAAAPGGDLAPIWASMGYDEINYTYRPDGKKLLNSIGAFSPQPFHVRPHYMFCSGSGWGQPHWGNGNVYHEDADGNPFYDFTLLDETYDAITGAGHHVLVELGFTPKDLVPEKAVFPVLSSPTVYSAYEQGLWSFPPKDYGKWAGLCAATAAHVLERYGAEEVSTWVWELWNEPDIFYWRGTPQQYYDLYTVTVEAIRGVLPDARVGGPSVTGGDDGVEFLRGFLKHCKATGTPLDYVSFHTKGSAFTPWRTYGPIGAPAPVQESPSAVKMLFDNPNFRFQNTEYFPVFQAKLMKKLLDLSAAHSDNIEQATTWSFYFEGERYFEGTRSWTTQGGIEKPLMNAYRLFAKLGQRRLPA